MTTPLTQKDSQDAQQIAREAAKQSGLVHTQKGIDDLTKVIERATEADKDDLAERLRIAWSKYQQFFAVPPHGTFKQIRAMLELMPPRK